MFITGQCNIENLRSTGDQAGVLQQSLASIPGVISIAKTRQPIGWSSATTLKDEKGDTIEEVNFFQVDDNFVKSGPGDLARKRI